MCAGFVLDEKNTRLSVVAVHAIELQEIHLLDETSFLLPSQSNNWIASLARMNGIGDVFCQAL